MFLTLLKLWTLHATSMAAGRQPKFLSPLLYFYPLLLLLVLWAQAEDVCKDLFHRKFLPAHMVAGLPFPCRAISSPSLAFFLSFSLLGRRQQIGRTSETEVLRMMMTGSESEGQGSRPYKNAPTTWTFANTMEEGRNLEWKSSCERPRSSL
ncbi:hypothetical protein Mapa_015504 [Marchantia paleacea]|nr:hypothetical protein Mapa_015504 [Marchantia paleacea]